MKQPTSLRSFKKTSNRFGQMLGRQLSRSTTRGLNELRTIDDTAQKVKGASVLAGPYAVPVRMGIEAIHVGRVGADLARKKFN